MKRILCYGDSNTWGQNPNDYDEQSCLYRRYPEHVRWTSVMQDQLGNEYFVCEEGLCGRTTVLDDPFRYGWNGYKSLEVVFRTCDPVDCILIMLGTNDLRDVYKISANAITMGMERLVRELKNLLPYSTSGNAKIIIVNPVRPAMAGDGMYYWEFTEESVEKSKEMAARYKALAHMLNVEFFDANTVARVDGKDGVHLDVESHKKLGIALAEKVREVLK